MSQAWHIEGASQVDPLTGRETTADLYIADGRYVASPPPGPCRHVRAHGYAAIPGLMDLHVHLREPGLEAAETIESGCRAGAAGGFTTLVAMPNTNPPADSPAILQSMARRAEQVGLARVLPTGCLTRQRKGLELADLPALKAAGAVAFTDDGATVSNEPLMTAAMQLCRKLGVPVMDHALDPALSADGILHDGPIAKRLGVRGIPSEAEVRIVERDIRLAEATGCAIHIQHVSCADSAALIRQARRRGLRVSGEATPHHLALSENDISAPVANFKMSPPLRAAADREAILAAVCDGTLDVLATDHAPHTAASKAQDLAHAPFGIVGLETAVTVTYTLLVESGLLSFAEWLHRWTAGPAGVLGIPAPSLTAGQPADLCLLDRSSEVTIDPSRFLSRSRNTPFEGFRGRGHVALTLLRGQVTWHDGKLPIDTPKSF